jgi:hypothetical protein
VGDVAGFGGGGCCEEVLKEAEGERGGRRLLLLLLLRLRLYLSLCLWRWVGTRRRLFVARLRARRG